MYCQNVDYMDSFITIQILHLLRNAKLIYYAFKWQIYYQFYGFQKNAKKFYLNEHFRILV